MDSQIILNSAIVFIFFLIIGFGLYTIMSMQQLKRKKKILAHLHQNMKVGNEVMFSGGLVGKIINIEEEFVQIQLDNKVSIKVSRFGITQILS